MTELIVGDEECPYKTLVNALLTAETSVVVADEWRRLARELSLSELTIKEFQEQKLLEKKKIVDILYDILVQWRLQVGSEATLENLVSCVSAIGWKNVADNLKVTFDMIKKSDTLQVKDTLPSPISYYVQRRLITRSLLRREIFNHVTNNIFVYFGQIERYQVTKLANGNPTDSSRNQVFQRKLSVKHILLDQLGDWERLRKKAVDPIHLINCHFDEDKFKWIESTGDVSLPQRFVKLTEEQDEYREDEFQEFVMDKIVYPLRRNFPIIIADSPGMGKSVLLSQIGRSLKEAGIQPIYIVIGNFVKDVQKKLVRRPTESFKLSVVYETLANYFCNPENAARALQLMTSSGSHNNVKRFELLFDGFDEIDEIDFELAFECISLLSQQQECIRLWITTRPHLLPKLEQRLGVPGYNIIPFTRTEQELFLEKFWTQCRKSDLDLDTQKLHRFIKECLDKVNALLKSPQNRYIAGIPLQCLLLAEAYESEALEFADSKNEAINFHNELYQVQINNITDMYKLLIANRFKKYFQTYGASAEETPRLMQTHVYFALKLIFPQCHSLLENLSKDMKSVSDLLNIGILETCSETEPPRFIHRTVAEYFISWFLAKLDSSMEQLLHLVLETHPIKVDVQKKILEAGCDILTHDFKHAGICHFTNALLTESENLPGDAVLKSLFCAADESQILQILHASQNSHCFSICKMLHKIIPQIWRNPTLMLITVWGSSVDFIQFLYSSLKGQVQPLSEFNYSDVPGEKSVLHLALLRGNFYIVEYLLHQQGFAKLIKSKVHSMRNILHHCVICTSKADAHEIQDRIQIMKMLLVEDTQLLHYKNEDGKSPILCAGIHVNLLVEMVRLECNLFETDNDGDTFLHIAANHLHGDEFFTLLSSLSSETLEALVKYENAEGETILHRLVASPYDIMNAIKLLLRAGADPKAQTKEGLSVLAFALKHEVNLSSRNSITVESLAIVLGVAETGNNDTADFTDALHEAASAGNLKAVEYFVDTKKQDVNLRNSEGKTPLESAVFGRYFKSERYDVSCYLKTRGALLDSDSENCNLLHNRILEGDVVGVRILLELYAMDTNVKSDTGGTLLHLALQSDVGGINSTRTEIVELLLKHGANVNFQNHLEESPLMFAIRHRPEGLNFKVFKLLVDGGAEISEEVAPALLLWLCVQKKGVLSYPDVINYMNRNLECCNSSIPMIAEGDNTVDLENKSVLDYLLLHGWNTNSVDDDGKSLLQYAVIVNRDITFLRYLLDLGVNPKLKTNHGSTLLHTCASVGRLKALSYFLQLGQLDIDAEDNDGDTPLHCAVIDTPEDVYEITKLLLETGADSMVLNKKGETPRDSAVRLGAEYEYLLLFDAKRCKLQIEKPSNMLIV